MHLIRRSHNPDFMGKIKEALNTVKGGFAYLIMLEDKLVVPWTLTVSSTFNGK